MTKKITTVCGDISHAELGVTSLHEHTFLDLRIAGKFMKNYFKSLPAIIIGQTDEMVHLSHKGSFFV